MNELLSQVGPSTTSIVWLHSGELRPSLPTYATVDYLLNGLLTASLSADDTKKGRVIVSENFQRPLFVYVASEVQKNEYESFLNLFKSGLVEGESILVIDETGSFDGLKKATPKDLQSRLQLTKK
jgi:hypothetical protein